MAYQYPVCDGTLDFSTGEPVCTGVWAVASTALSLSEAMEFSGAIAFVLALALLFKFGRKAMGV